MCVTLHHEYKIMRMLRQILTGLMLLTTLNTHAQCMKVHHSDGWTEDIPVNQIDSITFNDSTNLLAPTVMLNNGMSLPTPIVSCPAATSSQRVFGLTPRTTAVARRCSTSG